MRWRRVRSPDVIDRRGARGGGLPMGRGGAVGGGLGSSVCSWCWRSQQQLGTSDEVRGLQSDNPDEANELSVRLELQAGGYSAARERALTRVEGRDYVMQDGDVVTFRFTPS